MSEEAELQAKIAALAGNECPRRSCSAFNNMFLLGRINIQKQSSSTPAPSPVYSPGFRPPQSRWTPYAQPHQIYPRGGGYHKPGFPGHRNKTLVVNSGTATPVRTEDPAMTGTPNTPGWVSKRDRGNMQLINTSVYDQKMQQKQLDMEETAKERQRQKNEKEKSKVIRHVHAATGTSNAAPDTPREIVINDMRFRVAADGSKLIRIFGEFSYQADMIAGQFLNHADGSNKDAQTTPKEAKIAGVTFHRSKNGNLYRAGLVRRSLRYQELQKSRGKWNRLLTAPCSRAKTTKSTKLCPKFTSTGTLDSNHSQACPRMTGLHETKPLLNSVGRPRGQSLTLTTGICPLGPRCRFTHDINKIAICQQFLRHGNCAAGEECNLSHDLTPNRVPLCIHFIRGNCTNENCRYSHVRPSSSAHVCRPFATLGYCEKGAECDDRHVNECPDYANTGTCRDANCRLPHVDSVANKRRADAAKAAGKKGSPDPNESDMSSDEEDYQEIDSDDVDSDDLDEDEVMTGSGEQSHELSQQQDFVAFS